MKRFVILMVLFGPLTLLHAQKIVPPLSTDVLARVGSTVITAKDLIERIELMPWPEKEKPKHHDSSKVKALNSLIAERLLSLEGRMQKVGADDVAQLKLKTMEKLFVRDELYKRQVTQKITVSESEIRDGLAKFAWQLHLCAVALKDREAADSLYRMLQRNFNLTAVLKTFPSTSIASVETVQVNFGGLDTVFENTVYAMGKRKFTKPFECPTYGWTVALLIDKGTNPVAEKMSAGDRRYRVDETIRSKKEGPVARRFIASVLVPQKATVDSAMFELLADTLHAMFSSDSAGYFKNGMFSLSSDDVDELEARLRPVDRKPFVLLADKPMTLGEGLEGLRHLRLGFQSLEMKKFKKTLNNHVRYVVETELLAREGYKQQLQYSDAVKHDVDMWGNYWTSRYLMWDVDDTVRVTADEELAALDSIIPQMGKSYEVSIQEVLCNNLMTATRVFADYANGVPFAELVRTHSIRQEWKGRDGRSGYIPLTVYPELTRRAFFVDTGKIVGPVKVADGYSIFKVLGKRKTGGTDLPEVDSVRINLCHNLTAAKRQRTMNGYVAGLAKRYTVDIKYDKLSSVKIQPANMYTRRNIGFGGVITASPVLYPNWEWVKEYRDGNNINP